MFKSEFNSSMHAQTGALAAVASKTTLEKKRTKPNPRLVIAEEFICQSPLSAFTFYKQSQKFSATIPNLINKSMCILTSTASPKQTALYNP